MIVDTSVWIEFLQGSDSASNHWLTDRITDESPLVVPEVVLMELMIGTTDEQTATVRRRFLRRFSIESLAPVRDAEDAAIHRRCRRGGDTVRSLIDCQVAAVAMRLKLPVAHRDRDFEVIRTHCGLQTLPLL